VSASPTDARPHLVQVELARPADLFATPTVEIGSTVGGFTPGIDRCLAELTSHPDRQPVRIEVALPADQITADLPERIAVSLRRFCAERIHQNTLTRAATVRSGLRAFGIGLPVTFVGLAITAGATRVGDIDDALRAVIDIVGWVLAWVGLWYPFDKILFYPLDGQRENRALTRLRDAQVTIVALPGSDRGGMVGTGDGDGSAARPLDPARVADPSGS
jgi:hypothetical protein